MLKDSKQIQSRSVKPFLEFSGVHLTWNPGPERLWLAIEYGVAILKAGMKSLFLELTLQCQKCGESLPVNRAAEALLCVRCFAHTETPAALWQFLIAPRFAQAFNMEEDEDSRARGLHAGIGSYSMTFGRKQPRCSGCGEEWSLDQLVALNKQGRTSFQCEGCQTAVSLRTPPEWFRVLVPRSYLLVGETAEETQRTKFKPEKAVTIHCYHCGASLPLDGKDRAVLCAYCGKQCLIPDDIWMRLHPVETAHGWFVIVDAEAGAILLPEDISSCIDIAALSRTDTALLWEDDNGICAGRLGTDGFLRWMLKDLALSSYARIFYSAGAGTIWILDHDEEIVLALDADTGEEQCRVANEDHEPDRITVLDHRGVAVSRDTLLVYRNWETGLSKSTISDMIRKAGPHVLTQAELDALNDLPQLAEMHRFDREGRRIPLWPQQPDGALDHSTVEWITLRDRPALLPDDALMETDAEGVLYLVHPNLAIVARFDPQGRRTHLVRPVQKEISNITDFAIDPDGSILVAFEHRKKINRETWMHVGRISLDGQFTIIAGPHAPGSSSSLGTSGLRISIDTDRNIHLCGSDFGNFRRLSPDGSTLWRSVWTVLADSDAADELASARGER